MTLTAALLSVAAAACSSSPLGVTREMSCVSPTLTVAPSQVSPGQQVHVHGEWFATCDDVISPGAHPDAAVPLTGLVIQVAQQGQIWSVASGLAASGAHGIFDTAVRLPTELASGTAAVAVKGHGASVKVTVH